eukprot:Seg4437.2 transcript_id=Seg4437.2/GoldUCD/mRNA.D3Y31 product="hypothetical protein" protein_id=Seg4437.2/GoldUCD/D3Y31
MKDPYKSVKKSVKDKYIFQNKGILILDRKLAPSDGVAQPKGSFVPLDGLMILAENNSIEDFNTKVVSYFGAHNFTLDFSSISGGESISIEHEPILTDSKPLPVKVHLKLYYKHKKIMIQGNPSALDLWLKHYYALNQETRKDSLPQNEITVVNKGESKIIEEIQEPEMENKDPPSTPSNKSSLNIHLTPRRQNMVSELKVSVCNLESRVIKSEHEMRDRIDSLSKKLQLVDELSFLKDKINQIENINKTEIKYLKEQIHTLQITNDLLEGKIFKLESENGNLKQSIKSLNTSIPKQFDVFKKEIVSTTKPSCNDPPDSGSECESELDCNGNSPPHPLNKFGLLSGNYSLIQESIEDPSTKVKECCDADKASTSHQRNQHDTSSAGKSVSISVPEELPVYNPWITVDSTRRNSQQKIERAQIDNPETILLIDSNGKFIRLRKMFPRSTSIKIGCPLIQNAKDFISSHSQKIAPKNIICHFGTNDLDHSHLHTVADNFHNTILDIATKFPHSKIYISLLLPRGDPVDTSIPKLNDLVTKKCSQIPNAHFIHHHKINDNKGQYLRDNKHLNRDGFMLFIRNLKSAIFGRPAYTKPGTTGANRLSIPKHFPNFPSNQPQQLFPTFNTQERIPHYTPHQNLPFPQPHAMMQGNPLQMPSPSVHQFYPRQKSFQEIPNYMPYQKNTPGTLCVDRNNTTMDNVQKQELSDMKVKDLKGKDLIKTLYNLWCQA